MSNQDIHDKAGEPIREGDHVYTKSMGDRHEGDVKKIITSVSEAEKEGVKNPPKVLFTDQKGNDVAHEPETLAVKEQHKEYESSNVVGA